MPESAQFFLSIGAIFVLGMAADTIGRRTAIPRVTLLVVIGLLVGPSLLDLLPGTLISYFDMVAVMALVIIGFVLGGKLSRDSLSGSGNKALIMSAVTAVGTVVCVATGLLLLGLDVELALLLGCIAAATAPAATIATVNESGIDSRFSRMLLLIVALDDIWGLVLFSLGLAVVGALQGMNGVSPLELVATDIGGGILIGLLLGLPAAYLTGRIKPGEPLLLEGLALTFLCSGLALWAEASFLIAAIVMGIVVGNLAHHHEYPFHDIENIERPFLVVFFVLAGASLELNALTASGFIGAAYVGLRILGKILSARFGARLAGISASTGRWTGIAMLPQAGVAVGMALVAANTYPALGEILLPVVIASTVVFELIGPICTRRAIAAAA